MSHLNRKGKTRSMRHKSYKKVKKNRRSVKRTRKMHRMHRKSAMRMKSRRHRKSRHVKSRHAKLMSNMPVSYGYGYGRGRGMGKTFRGGSGLRSLLPMELVNLGDNIRSGISSVAHDFVGSVYDPPRPMPHLDHKIDRNDQFILPKVADVNAIYNNSAAKVASLYA